MNKTIITVIALSFLVSGCASFGRGVAEAIMKPQQKSNGECLVFSEGFDGIEDVLARNDGKVRVLMIHGIGKKVPGYSTGIVSSIAFKLGMNITAKTPKNIDLKAHDKDSRDLGHLRVYKYTDKDAARELLFYEYTWAGITEPIKNSLQFDYNDFNADKRTELSKMVKAFINETGTDAVIYLGNKEASAKIQEGVSHVLCWMLSDSWENLPESGAAACSADMISLKKETKDFVVITHSLGSQISVDALESLVSDAKDGASAKPAPDKYKSYAQNTRITIYMFANQLPAIAIGKEAPDVFGKVKDYCQTESPLYGKRFVNNTSIVAFSDPNDVLSYAIPPDFENKHIDSRLCPDITNVLVNVAHLSSIFGSTAANPLEAHSNYKKDERVLNLIINGIHDSTPQSEPDKGCYIIKTEK